MSRKHRVLAILSIAAAALAGASNGQGPATLQPQNGAVLAEIEGDLRGQIEGALRYQESIDASGTSPEIVGNEAKCAAEITSRFLEGLPELRRLLSLDVQAAYDGDPAALTYAEVQLAYPGLLAVASHRIARSFFLPRDAWSLYSLVVLRIIMLCFFV